MTYEERVRAIAASAPPLTSAQLATIATNLKSNGPDAQAAKHRIRPVLDGKVFYPIV